jgi:hypothetical protein
MIDMKTIDNNRRYDIDWLRVIAIGLLLIYHIVIGFQPWGVFIQFIQSETSLESLWVPMAMLNIWRIPLLFFVSGMGVYFAIRKRNWKQLLLERTKRILVPFIFGVIFIVPLHILLWQKYYSQDIGYSTHPGHLWFLANIFIYVLVLSPLFFYLKRNENGKIITTMKRIFKNPLGLILLLIPFILEALILNPEIFTLYTMTAHGFFLGLLAFFFGFCFGICGETFWKTILKWRWLYLSIAILLYVTRIVVFQLEAPGYLMTIESNIWIFAIFGFAYKYLNSPSKTLSYLSQAAYPIYIIHMIFLYLSSFILFPLSIPVELKLVLSIVFTSLSCYIIYEFVIRRARILRPLFGLKEIKVENMNRILQLEEQA